MRARNLAAWTLAASAALIAIALGCRPKQVRHNVILVSLDTLRADRVGYWGNPEARTPNLDRLASEGVAFMDASANAPITLASHMSIFTGLYPSKHRVSNPVRNLRSESDPGDELSARIRTLPELFRDAGYRTARFVYLRDYFLDPGVGFDRGFDELHPYGLDSRSGAAGIARWIAAQGERPYFLFIHSKRPHGPYILPDDEPIEDLGEYKGELPATMSEFMRFGREHGLGFLSPVPGIIPDEKIFLGAIDREKPEEIRRISRLYDKAVSLTDRYLGTVLDSLRASGQLDRTLLIVTSDHGEEFLEHGGLSHTKLNHEILHVPLLFRLPAAMLAGAAGRKVDGAVQTVDIFPSVLELTGLRSSGALDGQSLVPLLRGGTAQPREIHAQNHYVHVPRSTSVRSGKWKLILTEGEEKELYDVEADPREQRNVAAGNPKVVTELETAIKNLEYASYNFEPGR